MLELNEGDKNRRASRLFTRLKLVLPACTEAENRPPPGLATGAWLHESQNVWAAGGRM